MEILDFWARSLQQYDDGATQGRGSAGVSALPPRNRQPASHRVQFRNGYATNPDPTFHFFSVQSVFLCLNWHVVIMSPVKPLIIPCRRHPDRVMGSEPSDTLLHVKQGNAQNLFFVLGFRFFCHLIRLHGSAPRCSLQLRILSMFVGRDWQSAKGCYNIWTFRKHWLLPVLANYWSVLAN